MDSNNPRLLAVEEYGQVIDLLESFVVLVLRRFLQHEFSLQTKDSILRNFLSRMAVSLRSIMVLFKEEDFHNCWVILRCVIDRLIHIGYLQRTNSFEEFEKWSLMERYKYLHKIKSDVGNRSKFDKGFKEAHDFFASIVSKLDKSEIQWHRPRARETAKQMGLDFIYHYGYDHASTFVHPLADEGFTDFERLMHLPRLSQGANPVIVLQNSCFAGLLTLRHSLSASSLSWKSDYLLLLDNLMRYSGTGNLHLIEKARVILANLGSSPA